MKNLVLTRFLRMYVLDDLVLLEGLRKDVEWTSVLTMPLEDPRSRP